MDSLPSPVVMIFPAPPLPKGTQRPRFSAISALRSWVRRRRWSCRNRPVTTQELSTMPSRKHVELWVFEHKGPLQDIEGTVWMPLLSGFCEHTHMPTASPKQRCLAYFLITSWLGHQAASRIVLITMRLWVWFRSSVDLEFYVQLRHTPSDDLA